MTQIDNKLARFRVDVAHETGRVTLSIETGCGVRPVMGWPDIDEMEDFARTLLGICLQVAAKKSEPNGYISLYESGGNHPDFTSL